MVYKIVGKFDIVDFDKLLTKLSKDFLCMYLDNALYIALKDYSKKDDAESLVKQATKPVKYFFIEEITEKNIKKQSDVVQQWCSDNMNRLIRTKVEIEQQEQLQQIWKSMDDMEKTLQAKIIEKENLEHITSMASQQ